MSSVKSSNLIENIVHSPNRVTHRFVGNDISDALQFGFSFIESEDYMVEYLIVNSSNAKKIILRCKDDIEVDPDDVSIGSIWSARIVVSNRLKDNQIFFSNGNISKVLNVYVNGGPDANL